MATINPIAEHRIKGNQRLIGRLMVHFDAHYVTILRWLKNDDLRLTTPACVEIIKEETGLSTDEILEEENKATITPTI